MRYLIVRALLFIAPFILLMVAQVPWWLSALNYAGLALLLGVSMCLVIGGNHLDPRSAGLGGLAGGALYTVLLLMQCVVLYTHIGEVRDATVPMLTLFETLHPAAPIVIVVIVVAMIYNTAIGLLYALGRRLTANTPSRFVPVFFAGCLVSYAVSFVGFSTLMEFVYPAIGYLGLIMIVTLVVAWVTHREPIEEETVRRGRMRRLVLRRRHPRRPYGRPDESALEDAAEESPADHDKIIEVLERDVVKDIEQDLEVDPERSAGPGAPNPPA